MLIKVSKVYGNIIEFIPGKFRMTLQSSEIAHETINIAGNLPRLESIIQGVGHTSRGFAHQSASPTHVLIKLGHVPFNINVNPRHMHCPVPPVFPDLRRATF